MVTAVRPSKREIERRQELIAQSREKPLADKEGRELSLLRNALVFD